MPPLPKARSRVVDAAIARLIGLRDELSQLIADDDDRWYAFGFDKPSDPDTPEVPVNVVITPGAAGSKTLFIDWPDARRGDSYRVVVRNTASGGAVAEEIVTDSDATFTNLTSGMAFSVTVTARNTKGGESAESVPATTTVP